MGEKPYILVVDDEPMIRDLLVQQFSREGYRVSSAASGTEMREKLDGAMPDLVVLDLMLPDESGFALARELRAKFDGGIIFLTGKDNVVDKVVGLEIGADDYVTKPFEQRELLARVSSVLRRTKRAGKPAAASVQQILEFEGWRLDLVGHELLSPKGEPVSLTNYEFQMLAAFAQRPNRALSRDQLLDLVGNREWSPFDRSIDVLIGKLRQKIEADPKKPSIIQTIRGVGYKFTVRVKASAP